MSMQWRNLQLRDATKGVGWNGVEDGVRGTRSEQVLALTSGVSCSIPPAISLQGS